jgi:PglZ domain
MKSSDTDGYKVSLNGQTQVNQVQKVNLVNQIKETAVNSYSDSDDWHHHPPQPKPLHLKATPQEAALWVTEKYLPFRLWEVIRHPSLREMISNGIADSFVEWIVTNYPAMLLNTKQKLPQTSELTYSISTEIKNICQKNPVLLIVINSLGWLEHLELLSILKNTYNFTLEQEIQPKFSVIPTKTKYSKASLYIQQPPTHPFWKTDENKAFSKLGMGKRYTDNQLKSLYTDLNKKTHQLYCWETLEIHRLYQNQEDWHSIYEFETNHVLRGIATKIYDCVNHYPKPEKLRIIITSDCGQLMGISEKISALPVGLLQVKGRIAIGWTEDERFVHLKGTRYGLPDDISIVRGSGYLSSFSYSANKTIIDSHGGLFPEEVIVGMSILKKAAK